MKDKVYCRTCKFYWQLKDKCEETRGDYYSSRSIILVSPSIKNRLNNCKDYKKRKR